MPLASTKIIAATAISAGSAILGSLLALALLLYAKAGGQLAPTVTQSGVLALRPGMTTEQITDLLGPPLCTHPRTPGETVLVYGRPGLFGSGIEMSVIIRDDLMRYAGIEQYDLGAYWCHEHQCPVIHDAKVFERLPATPLNAEVERAS